MEDIVSFRETEDAILHKQAIFQSSSPFSKKKKKIRITSLAVAQFTYNFSRSESSVEHLTSSSVYVIE